MTIEITNESGVEVDETVLLRLTEHNLAELHVSADADRSSRSAREVTPRAASSAAMSPPRATSRPAATSRRIAVTGVGGVRRRGRRR